MLLLHNMQITNITRLSILIFKLFWYFRCLKSKECRVYNVFCYRIIRHTLDYLQWLLAIVNSVLVKNILVIRAPPPPTRLNGPCFLRLKRKTLQCCEYYRSNEMPPTWWFVDHRRRLRFTEQFLLVGDAKARTISAAKGTTPKSRLVICPWQNIV